MPPALIAGSASYTSFEDDFAQFLASQEVSLQHELGRLGALRQQLDAAGSVHEKVSWRHWWPGHACSQGSGRSEWPHGALTGKRSAEAWAVGAAMLALSWRVGWAGGSGC
jgi:hypothetical protein